MKKLINKVNIALSVSFTVLGIAIGAWFFKPANSSVINTGVTILGDTVIHVIDSTLLDTANHK